MLTSTTAYRKDLGDGLVLKSIQDERDVERLAQFNGAIHDETVTVMTRNLIMQHPDTRPEHWIFIEDENTGDIVSSLCLIPWTWQYDGVAVKTGEMGIVGTLENYRHRGLVRALADRHWELLVDGEYDMSHIQGIPYFYRLLGYEYALPLEGGWRVELHQIPDDALDESRFTFRQAIADDIPTLLELDHAANVHLNIHATRNAAIWAYLLDGASETDTAADTWLILENEAIIGYWRIAHFGFGKGLNIAEASHLSPDMAIAVLAKSKALALAKEKPYIRLNIERKHPLITTANNWGATDTGTYAWQIKLVNTARLLKKLTPLFEKRLTASPYANLTKIITLNLYREAFELHIEHGQVRDVVAAGFKEGGDLNIPPNVFVPFVLGYRSLKELADVYPDVGCWGQNRSLINTLFPKVESFIYTIY